MKIYKTLYIIAMLILMPYTSSGEDWYEAEEASSVAGDYVGAIDKAVTEESEGSMYTPEYSEEALQETMIERDVSGDTSQMQASVSGTSQQQEEDQVPASEGAVPAPCGGI